jgi:hypothetical protein
LKDCAIELKEALKDFQPDLIDYLAYAIEGIKSKETS